MNIRMLLILNLEAPEMLTEAVSVGCKDGARLFKSEPPLASFAHQLRAKQIRCLGAVRG